MYDKTQRLGLSHSGEKATSKTKDLENCTLQGSWSQKIAWGTKIRVAGVVSRVTRGSCPISRSRYDSPMRTVTPLRSDSEVINI